jgi:mono/diheme cytochrome c family protein
MSRHPKRPASGQVPLGKRFVNERRISPLAFLAASAFLAGALAAPVAAEDAGSPNLAGNAASAQTLEVRVAVLLARNCLECHNASDRKGGLDLTRREQALAGGDSGRVLKPGDPDRSPLWQRTESGEMPPLGARSSAAMSRRCSAPGSRPAPSGPPIRSILSYTRATAGLATTGGRYHR